MTELAGMEGEKLLMQELFRYHEEGTDAQGKVIGRLIASGMRPRFMTKLEACGINIPPETFQPAPVAKR